MWSGSLPYQIGELLLLFGLVRASISSRLVVVILVSSRLLLVLYLGLLLTLWCPFDYIVYVDPPMIPGMNHRNQRIDCAAAHLIHPYGFLLEKMDAA